MTVIVRNYEITVFFSFRGCVTAYILLQWKPERKNWFPMDEIELKHEVLSAATELFRTKGLKFTMQDVAGEVHAAKKTIYKLYESKEELLLDLVTIGFDRIQDAKRKILESDLPMREKIASVLIAMPDDYRTLDFRRLKGIEDKYPSVWKEIGRRIGSEWEPIFHLLEEGMKQGCVNPISLPVLKQIVSASIDSFMYTDMLALSGITYQEALEHMAAILMKGVWNDQA